MFQCSIKVRVLLTDGNRMRGEAACWDPVISKLQNITTHPRSSLEQFQLHAWQ